MDNTVNAPDVAPEIKIKKEKKPGMIKRMFRAAAASEYGYLAVAFLLPAAIMWLIFIAMGVYPFGGNSVLVLDLNGQYVSFFEYLRNVILHGRSMVYTFERSLGGEMLGIYAYYIASPFSAIVALFPKIHVTEALLAMHLLKCGSCGLTMALYLHQAHFTKKTRIITFSTMYALCAYAIVQAHNTMWIDELIILPMLVLGIERMIRRRDCTLYTVSLALAMIVNFYIGFMMCIFTVFYCVYYYFSRPEYEKNQEMVSHHFARVFLRLSLLSLIAAMIAAVIILPTYYALTFGKTTFSNPDYSFKQQFDFLDLIVKMYPGSYDTVRPTGLPFIYCGTLSLIMLPLFFTAPDVPKKEKIWGGVALAFFAFCFNGSTIDIFWHGLQKPNWLNFRYSFMLVFFIIVFGYKAFSSYAEKRIPAKSMAAVAGAELVLAFIIQKLDYEFLDDLKFAWVSAGCLLIWAELLGALYGTKKDAVKSASTLIIIFMSLEMFCAGLLNTTSLDKDVVYTSRTTYVTHMDRCSPLFNRILDSDHSFFRMEKTFHRKTNDPMAFGYNGLSNSSSLMYTPVVKLLNQMGYASKSNWSKSLGGTPVSNSLLGLKYIVFEEQQDGRFYEEIDSDTDNNLYAYHNPYFIQPVSAVNDAIRDLDFYGPENPFELMNAMITAMLGEEKTVEVWHYVKADDIDYQNCDISFVTGHKKYSPEVGKQDARIAMKIKGAGLNNDIYIFVPTEYPRECSIYVGGSKEGNILGNDTDCIQKIGAFEDGEDVYVSLKLEKEELYIANSSKYFYYLDTELYKQIMPRLREAMMQISEFSDTRLYGIIDIPAGSGLTTLYTTIPYDEGWQVYIDGERTEIFKTSGDALLAADISEGRHTVELLYRQKPLAIGAVLCVAGVVCLIGVMIFDRLWHENHRYIPDPPLEEYDPLESDVIDVSGPTELIPKVDPAGTDGDGP
ncbi:MAG: YfhO family protein, partial [Clostridiales bacterium]|nr:YfhO family protein [Clostridiales bacterium]